MKIIVLTLLLFSAHFALTPFAPGGLALVAYHILLARRLLQLAR